MSIDETISNAAHAVTKEDIQQAQVADEQVTKMYGGDSENVVQVVRPLVMQKHGGKSEAF